MDDMEAMGQMAAARSAERTQAELAKLRADQEKQHEELKNIEEDRLKLEKKRIKAEEKERRLVKEKEEAVRQLRSDLAETIALFDRIKGSRAN